MPLADAPDYESGCGMKDTRDSPRCGKRPLVCIGMQRNGQNHKVTACADHQGLVFTEIRKAIQRREAVVFGAHGWDDVDSDCHIPVSDWTKDRCTAGEHTLNLLEESIRQPTRT